METLTQHQIEILRLLKERGPRRLVDGDPSPEILYLIQAEYVAPLDATGPSERYFLTKRGLEVAAQL